MIKKMISGFAITVALVLGFSQMAQAAGGSTHRLLLQVNDSDPKRINLALNNASNVAQYYIAQGEEVAIEVVAYGPGVSMFIEGQSTVANRVKTISENFENISFKYCNNTYSKMSKKAGKDLPLLPQATKVAAGVVHMMQRQEEGWSYIRP